ncbi:MAG: ABC1 kinase family protein [Oceanococcus sp.]
MSDSDSSGKPSLQSLKTKPWQRNMSMTLMGAGTGVRAAGHGFSNLFRSSDKRAQANREYMVSEVQHFVDQLGQLKGSVMKAGQMLSLYGQYFMPEEAVEILQSLQDDTVHVDWSVVEPVVERALGQEKMNRLTIDKDPLAAASLGQVHRVTLADEERKLCMKIRYPGVDGAIDSDMKTIGRLLALSHFFPEHLSPQSLLEEIREMLHREVDYAHEARMTKTFRQRLSDDKRFIVPTLESDYCTGELILMSFEDGVSLRSDEVRALPQAQRDALGQAFFELFCTEFFDWHLVQTDPHYGNYRIRLDEQAPRIVLLDFGATREFPADFVRAYSRILLGGIQRDPESVIAGACGIGLMEERFPENVKMDFYNMICQIMEPFCCGQEDVRKEMFTKNGEYLWAKGDVFVEAGKLLSRAATNVHFKMPPREIIFLHRRLAGVYMLLGYLDCKLDMRATLMQALQSVINQDK